MEFTSRADMQLRSQQPRHWQSPTSMSHMHIMSYSLAPGGVHPLSPTPTLAVAWQMPIYACKRDPVPFSWKGWFWWNEWTYKFVRGWVFWI